LTKDAEGRVVISPVDAPKQVKEEKKPVVKKVAKPAVAAETAPKKEKAEKKEAAPKKTAEEKA